MLPKTHITFGAVFSLILFFLLDFSVFSVLIVFFASFLIDVDHYFYGIYKKKTFHLGKIYSYFKEQRVKWKKLTYKQKLKTKFPILLFHGFEFLLLLFLLSFLSNLFLFVLLGCIFHFTLDYIDILISKDSPYLKSSVIYVFLTNKHKKL